MNKIGIPIVVNDSLLSKNSKMIITIAIIITMIILLMYYGQEIIRIEHNNMECITMKSDNLPFNLVKQVIDAKYIIISNLIPIQYIMYITNDNIINYISKEHAIITKTDKSSSIMFTLPHEKKITEVILAIDIFNKFIGKLDIAAAQVIIKNKYDTITWVNYKSLDTNTNYIYLPMVKKSIIYKN